MGKNKKKNKPKPEGVGPPMAIGWSKITDTTTKNSQPHCEDADPPAAIGWSKILRTATHNNKPHSRGAGPSVARDITPVENKRFPKADSKTGSEYWNAKPTIMDESDSLYADILEELECPICTQYMIPPIRQCETGHSICQSCMKKLPWCPLCRKNFINAKNMSLQALACKVSLPCVNQSLGCTVKLKLDQKDNHEKNCSFRGYKCAMENCTWVGKLEDIVNHWIWDGHSGPLHSSMVCCKTDTKFDSYFVSLVNEYDQLFWSKGKIENGRIYWAVQLIGPADKASNYFYEIDIYKSELSERRIILKDYCKSIELDNNELFSKDICITTASSNRLKHFVDENQFLIYYKRINSK